MGTYGLIGEKLTHSLSPNIHHQIFELMGIQASYQLFPISQEEIAHIATHLKSQGIKGVNVTMPYKERVLSQLDVISDEAKAIGAVNTIELKEDKLHGYNTDYFGFGKMLVANRITAHHKTAVILGTGGASKAVVTYLLDNQIKNIYLVTRNKSQPIVPHPKAKVISYEDLKGITGDLLINTTPVGMSPIAEATPVGIEIVKNYTTLIDLIYHPQATTFLKLGKSCGKITLDGLYMLIAQAVKTQKIWQEQDIPDCVIDNIYLRLNEQLTKELLDGTVER